jgi:hypothetical protein
MTFTPITHQFSLFEYNEMRPKYKVPIKRISRARMEQAVMEMKSGKPRKLSDILSDVNDALERFDKRLTNKRNGIQK